MSNIQSEVQFLKSCQHPNIIRYIDAVRAGEKFYIITEWMESKSVADVISRFGKLQESLTRNYISQISRGLAYLHERNIIHRDVKAANVLVSKDGFVKLADFGIALQLRDTSSEDSDKETQVIQGSPYWMAPEVIQMHMPTVKSDVWSMGCTALEMIVGAPPYYELSPMRAFYRIVNDSHPPLPIHLFSKNLADMLHLVFIKDPNYRPTAEALLSHPWLNESGTKEKER